MACERTVNGMGDRREDAMLEPMDLFFERRLAEYDAHMIRDIFGAAEFYPFTASQLPLSAGCRVLDLGCGTGLELEYYFALNPGARVTGIDISAAMLRSLAAKFPDKALTLVLGSYFDVEFGAQVYDAAVSVESLHHFPSAMKVALYRKLHAALKDGGRFVLTDYFAASPEEEKARFAELDRLRRELQIADGALYHFDTPLTVEHEVEALSAAGFAEVKVLRNWKATYTLLARK